jgi:hypothetical protein
VSWLPAADGPAGPVDQLAHQGLARPRVAQPSLPLLLIPLCRLEDVDGEGLGTLFCLRRDGVTVSLYRVTPALFTRPAILRGWPAMPYS